MGRQVNVGVRPEDLVQTEGAFVHEGRVDITEALGEVTLLYFEASDGHPQVIAKLPGTHAALRGRTVRISAVPEKVHLFSDGQSLRSH